MSLLVVVCVCVSTAPAAAQTALFTGQLTGYIGVARAGDVREATTTGGVSLAVIDVGGLGAEFDVGHTGEFDRDFFVDASMTSFMLNFVALYPHETFRPFVNVGAGALRIRTASVGRTEPGWNAGGGLALEINDVFGLRADVRYFRLLDRPEDFGLRDNGFFDYWRTSIGASFSWPIR